MAQITMRLQDAGKHFEDRYAKRREVIIKTLQSAGRVALGSGIAQSIASLKRPPVNTGMYKKAFMALPHQTGVKLFNPLPYAPMIEHGRRPGTFPPIDAIAHWLAQKNLRTEPEAGKARGRRLLSGKTIGERHEEASATGLAFVVARAIARRGLDAKGVLTRAYRDTIRSMILEELKAVLNRV